MLQDAADEGGVLFVEVGGEGGGVELAGEDALDGGGDAPVAFFELGQDLLDLGAGFRAFLVGPVAPGPTAEQSPAAHPSSQAQTSGSLHRTCTELT